MASGKLKVGFAGARWLGVECLKVLVKRADVEITAVCCPSRSETVWWKDIVDQDEIEKLGFRITPWEDWFDLKFDLVFSILNGRIFKRRHIENARYGILNLHCAPLPRYRGRNGNAHAILNGDRAYGVTLHYVDEGIDTGPIIAMENFPIHDVDTGWTLHQRSQERAYRLFCEVVPGILRFAQDGKVCPAQEQDEREARYYRADSLMNKEADLNWDKGRLYDFVRALDFPPFEPAYVVLRGQKVYLTLASRGANGWGTQAET